MFIGWPGIIFGWTYVLYFQLVHPIITQRKVKGYRNKLLAQSQFEIKGILGDLARKFRSFYMLFFYLAITLYLTYFAGMSSAYRKTSYLMINTSPEMVVLKVYNDRLIVAPIDKKNKVISPEFTFINLDDSNIPALDLEDIGPISTPKK